MLFFTSNKIITVLYVLFRIWQHVAACVIYGRVVLVGVNFCNFLSLYLKSLSSNSSNRVIDYKLRRIYFFISETAVDMLKF